MLLTLIATCGNFFAISDNSDDINMNLDLETNICDDNPLRAASYADARVENSKSSLLFLEAMQMPPHR